MHKCVRCGSVYEDNDANILRGCTSCGAIFFLYVKGPRDVTQLDAVEKELQSKETTLEKELAKQIEKRKSEIGVEVGTGAGVGAEEKLEAEVEKEVEREAKEAAAAEIEEVEFVKEKKAKRKAKRGKAKKAKGARKGPKLKIKIKAKKAVSVRKDVVTIGEKKFAVEDLFGIETIRVPKDGVYEINIDALMKNQPVIVLERGQIYVIHLPEVFETVGKK